MRSIIFFIIISLFSSLAFTAEVDTAGKAEARKQLMEILTNKDKQKELLCGLIAINAHSAYGMATNEINFPKSSAESVMEMDSYAEDSLHYELIRIAIDDGYKKIPSEVTYKKIMTYCISKTMEQVSDMDTGRQEALDDEAWQKAWDEKGCTKREDDLQEARNANFDGESDDIAKKFLKSVKNSELEKRVLHVLQQKESEEKNEAFDELVSEFHSFCGQGE
ncbi:MAG: hypothetical protein ACI9T7_001203 [Oleiphilaceae bacterium]